MGKCEYCGNECDSILKPHEACCFCYASYTGEPEILCQTCKRRGEAKDRFERRKQTLTEFIK